MTVPDSVGRSAPAVEDVCGRAAEQLSTARLGAWIDGRPAGRGAAGLALVSGKADPEVVKRNARRGDRLHARRVLWSTSTLPRTRKCGRALAVGNELGVSVRVSQTGDRRSAGFGGLQSCGSPWSCPWCASKIAAQRQADIAAAVTEWQRRGNVLGLVTLTMRHHNGQRLKTLWDAYAYAWGRVTSGRRWVDAQEALGVVMPRTVKVWGRTPAGDRIQIGSRNTAKIRVPTIRVVEVTVGANGWHVHVHALVFLRAMPDVKLSRQNRLVRALGRAMFGRWKAGLIAKGLTAPSRDSGGLDAHVVTGDASAFGEYFTKNQYSGAAAVALEMARADLKAARGKNRTPFEVLRSVAGASDYRDGDETLWAEWEQGSRNRRQIQWSPGLRELVKLPEAEKTDEDIAAEEQGGSNVAWIDTSDWYSKVCAIGGAQARVLVAAELGLQQLRDVLEDLGARYQLPAVVAQLEATGRGP